MTIATKDDAKDSTLAERLLVTVVTTGWTWHRENEDGEMARVVVVGSVRRRLESPCGDEKTGPYEDLISRGERERARRGSHSGRGIGRGSRRPKERQSEGID